MKLRVKNYDAEIAYQNELETSAREHAQRRIDVLEAARQAENVIIEKKLDKMLKSEKKASSKTSEDWGKAYPDIKASAVETFTETLSTASEFGHGVIAIFDRIDVEVSDAMRNIAHDVDSLTSGLVELAATGGTSVTGWANTIKGAAGILDEVAKGLGNAFNWFIDLFKSDDQKKAEAFRAELIDQAIETNDALNKSNKQLEKNRSLFGVAEKAALAYASVLNKVVNASASFYEDLTNTGSDLATMIVDSLISGFDNDDFLFSLQEYITSAIIRAQVFTESFSKEIASIGTDLAIALAGGDTLAIAGVRSRISDLYSGSAKIADHYRDAISGVFDTSSLNIAPSSVALSRADKSAMHLNLALEVDGRAMAKVSYKYQDQSERDAWGVGE